MENMIYVFVSAVAWILYELVKRVLSPVFECWALILAEFGVNEGGVVDLQKSVLMCLNKHGAISAMEDLSGPSEMQRNWVGNLLLHTRI